MVARCGILVTGGAGFIGSSYVRSVVGGRYPASAGAEVVVLDLLTYAGTLTNLAGVIESRSCGSCRATSGMPTSSTC
jgi:dTDP-D-glucose 4,6-dehydratase